MSSVVDFRDHQQPPGPPAAGIGRVPPHNLQAEESLLGAMLLTKDAVAEAVEVVSAENFYAPANQYVYEAIVRLYNSGQPIDVVTVANELDRNEEIAEMVGGSATLLRLQAGTPVATNAGRYALIVYEHAVLRKLISTAQSIADLGYSQPDDVVEAVDTAEQMMFDVAQGRVSDTTARLHDLLEASLDRLEELYEQGDAITGTPTGFIDLDKLTAGLQPSSLVVVGARPAMGKTSFALNIAAHAALEARRPVLFFSLEMSQLELSQRLLCSDARVNATNIRNGRLDETDWKKIGDAVGRMADAPIWVDDNPNVSIMEIRSKARRLKSSEGDLGLVVIDYLQLMTGRSGAESRQVEVSELSRGLKILARELECPVVALSQLSRGLEQRQDKRPMLADLRESGAIEQDADVVMFLYRDDVYNPDSADMGQAEVIIAKHRAGPIGTIRLAWLPHYTRFANMARNN